MRATLRCLIAGTALVCASPVGVAQTTSEEPGWTKAPDSVKTRAYVRKRPDGSQVLVVIDGAEQLSPAQTTEPVPVLPTDPIPAPDPTTDPDTTTSGYADDTHASLGSNAKVVTGVYGQVRDSTTGNDEPYKPTGLSSGTVLDARSAQFYVYNSKVLNPTKSVTCSAKSGTLPVSLYPVQVRTSPDVSLIGGIVLGQIPMASDWKFTYCNSAALAFWDSPGATVDGVRITTAWDAVRFSDGADNWTLKNSWMTNVRDDMVENDKGWTGLVKDVLVDGTFMGLSMAPGTDGNASTTTLDGVLMRMQTYLVEGKAGVGSPFKFDTSESASGKVKVHNTIISYDKAPGAEYRSLSRTARAFEPARMVDCSNNLLLFPNEPAGNMIPVGYPPPPSCFTVKTGAEAYDAWAAAKANFINCHPLIARHPDDPVSDPEACDPTRHGGLN